VKQCELWDRETAENERMQIYQPGSNSWLCAALSQKRASRGIPARRAGTPDALPASAITSLAEERPRQAARGWAVSFFSGLLGIYSPSGPPRSHGRKVTRSG